VTEVTKTDPHDADQVERAIEIAVAKLDVAHKAEAEAAANAAAHKAAIARRVSIAALLLTMMLSFLGFVRAQSDASQSGATSIVQQSRNDAATEWSLYQTKIAQRSGFIESEDTLAREVLSLGATDPRRRLARFHHHEYEAQVRALDEDNRQVFHRIQTLNSRAYAAQTNADHHARRTKRYDMGIRTLTLALVLISVTLLVDRTALFYFGLLVAAIGALFGVFGYFLR
jgi:hypothetical protein